MSHSPTFDWLLCDGVVLQNVLVYADDEPLDQLDRDEQDSFAVSSAAPHPPPHLPFTRSLSHLNSPSRPLCASLVQELREQVFRKVSKKRSLGSVQLELGHGASLGIKLYCLYDHMEVLTDRGFMSRAEVFAACPALAPSSPTPAPASDYAPLPFMGAVLTRKVQPLYWTPSAAEEKADEAAGIRHEQLTGPASISAVLLRDLAGRYGRHCGLCRERVWGPSANMAMKRLRMHNTTEHPAELAAAAASRTGRHASVTSAASASFTSRPSSSSTVAPPSIVSSSTTRASSTAPAPIPRSPSPPIFGGVGIIDGMTAMGYTFLGDRSVRPPSATATPPSVTRSLPSPSTPTTELSVSISSFSFTSLTPRRRSFSAVSTDSMDDAQQAAKAMRREQESDEEEKLCVCGCEQARSPSGHCVVCERPETEREVEEGEEKEGQNAAHRAEPSHSILRSSRYTEGERGGRARTGSAGQADEKDEKEPVTATRPTLARPASMPLYQSTQLNSTQLSTAVSSSASPLLFASLDPLTGHLVYLPATALVYQTVTSLMEFTHYVEAQRWAEDADEYGLTPDDVKRMKAQSDRYRAGERLDDKDKYRAEHYSNGVSLLVSRQHDMFARVGLAESVTGEHTDWTDDYVKIKAGSLLCDNDSRQRVRMTGQATAGFDASAISDDQLPFVAVLQLSTAQIDTFLWLYGYWCGDGYLNAQHHTVVFQMKKGHDKKEVQERLKALGFRVPSASVRVYNNADGTRSYEMKDKRWADYFFSEYGPKYGVASVSSSRPHTHTGLTTPLPKSVKWSAQQPLTTAPHPIPVLLSLAHRIVIWSVSFRFWVWVWRLRKARARLVLAGLRYADGNEAAEEKKIYTSGVAFRDEIIRLALHAGYTARFYVEYKKHDHRGWSTVDGTPMIAQHDNWGVSYSDYPATAEPILHNQRDIKTVQAHDGAPVPVWCVTVPPHNLIIARRVRKNDSGIVTQASKPLVVGNCLYLEAKKETPVFLSKQTNAKLTSETVQYSGVGDKLERHQIRKYFPFGGAKAYIDEEEMKAIKTVGEAGLVLMGFKSQERVRPYHNLRSPYFVYPDETQVKGSVRAFYALLLGMAELKVVAIARLIYRKGTMPRLVALIPQLEAVDEKGRLDRSPGMHLVFLPYADDIRDLDLPTPSTGQRALRHQAKWWW